jgi:hypothetical protein
MLLLLLGKHMSLLGLQMRQRVGIGSAHAWVHAHHGAGLAYRTVRARDAWVHAWGHLLAWIRSGAAHGVAMLHALRLHAGVVRVSRGHHLSCRSTSRVRAALAGA